MRLGFEKYRIFLSRIAATFVLFFICTTKSYWDELYKPITYSLFCIGIILVAIASLGRMWCSLYIAGYKDNQLVTKGPYSISRNPLYFFSLIGVVGIGFSTETLSFPIIFFILFAFYYPFVIKSEEQRLKQLFGSDFEEYTKKVPAFIPKFSIIDEPKSYTVNPITYRRHIFSAVWFVWLVGIIEVIEGLKAIGLFKTFWMIY